MVEVVGDEIIVHKISSGEGPGSGTMIEGCQAQVRRMCVTWPDFSFLMFSIPEGENKRGAKAESTPLREASAILRLMRIISPIYRPSFSSTNFSNTPLSHKKVVEDEHPQAIIINVAA